MEKLELWKNLLQKISTNPKMYDLSPYSKLRFEFIYFNLNIGDTKPSY